MSFKSPLVTDDILQIRVSAAGFAVRPVICAHYGLYLGFFNASFESGHVCLIEILIRACGIELVSNGLRS